MTTFRNLLESFTSGEIHVGILGLGYVGLPLAIACVRAGLRVTGYDIDEEKTSVLNQGRSIIRSVMDEQVAGMVRTERFVATTDFERFSETDAILICVPTPLGHHWEPDLSFVERASATVAKTLRTGQLVVLESSTYPGTTAEIVRPILEKTGMLAGKDFYLAYSPEREDPGNSQYTTSNTPRVVGADDPQSGELAEKLYSRIVSTVHRVNDTRTAEAVKITENAFRSVNIAFVNELKLIYGRMGINIWDVIEAAKTKPFGYMPFYPGPGLGGHCIPIDPFYLTWKAKEFDLTTRFVEIAGEINSSMPYRVVEQVSEGLGRIERKALNGARILLVGIAYKKNLDDLRESPALKIWDILERRGARVAYYDPHIPMVPKTREYAHLAGKVSVEYKKSVIDDFDALIVATDHDAIDFVEMTDWARLVFDTRNATRAVTDALKHKVVLV